MNEYCLIAAPIVASDQDTDETLRQVLQHNAMYKEICGD